MTKGPKDERESKKEGKGGIYTKDKGLGQGALLMERSVGLGQGKKISDLPEEMPGKGEKKGEGERGLGRALPFLSLCTLGREGRESGRSPAPLGNLSVRNRWSLKGVGKIVGRVRKM